MSTRETTTIEVDRSTVWRELNSKKRVGESFNDVLERILEEN